MAAPSFTTLVGPVPPPPALSLIVKLPFPEEAVRLLTIEAGIREPSSLTVSPTFILD